MGPMARRDWRRIWEGEYLSIRDQLRSDWSAGRPPRRGMKRWGDAEIDKYARAEASRRCERAIREYNDRIDIAA